jgi:hypothetical protein
MSSRKGNLEAWPETALSCLLVKDVDGWLNHWAEDGRIEFPFAPSHSRGLPLGKLGLHGGGWGAA